MSLTKQVLAPNVVRVHDSTMGKMKAGKLFCLCGHCDHHFQSDCVRKGCWCCSVHVQPAADIMIANHQATHARAF